MPKLFHHTDRPPAQTPGTVTFVGEQKVELVEIKLIDYDAAALVERVVEDVHDIFGHRDTQTVSWINVNGLHDTDLIHELGDHFAVHPLVLEDIVNNHQRPKMEDYGENLYIVVRMLSFAANKEHLISEQISLVIGPDHLLTFQERHGDVLEPVRERLRRGRGRIRTAGPGYLGYTILDAVIDHYFQVLETYAESIELLEEEVLDNPTEEVLQRIHHLKREMVLLRRAVWPVREVITRLDRAETPLLSDEVTPFLRDLQDHVLHVVDTVDAFRDILSGLQDLYLSSLSNRMNDVMKVLTIFASIFVPLTFIAGVYGMNFKYMPELSWRWSYPAFWVVIIMVGVTLLALFRRRKWF